MNLGYQSSSTYLALPDTLKTSFPCRGREVNVRQAPANDFHTFISQFVEEFEEVDTATWPIHLRWRVINACLADGLLRLAEVPGGLRLEAVELPQGHATSALPPGDTPAPIHVGMIGAAKIFVESGRRLGEGSEQ